MTARYDAEYHKEYYEKHKEHIIAIKKQRRVVAPEVRKRWTSKNRQSISHKSRASKYKMTSEQLTELLASGCAVCGGMKNLQVDHDHACCPSEYTCGGCTRECLCGRCNRMLAQSGEDINRLRAGIQYLLKWEK